MFSCHIIIAQTDYNKIEKGKKKWSLERVYQNSKRPRYEGTFEHGKEVGVLIL
jgi:hypothetical protein